MALTITNIFDSTQGHQKTIRDTMVNFKT